MATRNNYQGVGCAYGHHLQVSKTVFQDLCPVGFIVSDVLPKRAGKKPYCRWEVEYLATYRNASYQNGENARTVFSSLEEFEPPNARVFDKTRCENPLSWIITYGVKCTCPKDFEDDMTQFEKDEELKSA